MPSIIITWCIILTAVIAGMGGATEMGDLHLPATEQLWEQKVFPPEGKEAKDAATFTLIPNTMLGIGPWRLGEWSARYQLREAIPITRGRLSGWYRTENIPRYAAEVSIEFRNNDQRVAVKNLRLGPAEEWRPFELIFRVSPPGANAVVPRLGLVAHTEGRVWFRELMLSATAPDFVFAEKPITRPAPPHDFPKHSFFRVALRDGVWWLMTPNGAGFYAAGTDGPWFRTPEEVLSKGQKAARVLHTAGFTSLAGWSDIRGWSQVNHALVKEGKLPFTLFHALETSGWEGECDALLDAQGRTTGQGHAFPDPFDPRFEENYRREMREVAEVVKDDLWFVGYFADNEVSHRNLYRHVYSPHCAIAFQQYLQTRYPTIAALNHAWDTHFISFDDLLTQKPEPVEGRQTQDFRAFSREIVQRYVTLTQRIIREEDPNHLVISNRFMLSDISDWVDYLDLYAGYDIVTVNIYPGNQRAGLSEDEIAVLRLVHEKTGRPILIGEWSVPAVDSGLYNRPDHLDWSWNEVVATQQERAQQAASVALDFYNLPFIVGAHWFIWQDIDTEKRQANRGLIRRDGSPWKEVLIAFAQVHARLHLTQPNE